ncbi:MAG: magnesium transporter [Methanosarcinaceae archaeon]|jgi:mgtE-like transporter|nr:magnesium transporter [Methanosarcinaceae archaeon]NKQ39244.1 divalent cation transporter [Methanosarcinales archaeon]
MSYDENSGKAKIEEYASVGSIIREALPFEFVATTAGVVAGIVFAGMKGYIELIPGLIVLAPAIAGMRGNIASSLGSRLGSAIHMGFITKIENNPELNNNALSSIILSVILSIWLGILGHYMTLALGFESVGVFTLVAIAVFAGVTSGIILTIVAIISAIYMFKFGFDPDNMVSPAMSTIGDITAMLMIYVAVRLVML